MKNKSWFRTLFVRRFIIIILILLQTAFLVYPLVSQTAASAWAGPALQIVSVLLALRVISAGQESGYRMVWVVLMLLVPVIGIPFYFLFRAQSGTKRLNRRIHEITFKAQPSFALNPSCYEDAKAACKSHSTGLNYLQLYTRFPVCRRTQTQYYSPGEYFFEALLKDLETARRYIFLEYFIVSEGYMWDAVFDILKRKAAQGVDVRLLYDDMGCFLTIPPDFDRRLEEVGIKCSVFMPFTPFVSAMQNNRDHRKICSVDGRIAYTGGINLADEYINRIDKHGHWKDSALRLEGEAAWNMTVIFLEQWELTRHVKEDYLRFYPWHTEECAVPDDGFVLPYADSPVDDENVGEHVYLHIINSARNYLYICSPYLIVDDTLASALSLSAKSGVDVRIITPDRADKRFVHFTTQSYYRQLIRSGVRIYQYTGGFMHSKTFVSDDVVATVGTTNLDYRSLYLNFECGVWMYGSRAVMQVKQDFLSTLEVCHEMGAEDCSCSGLKRLWQEFLRVFAPLM
ncbi:MAG: cardiolipin synthase [Candidatus Heteroscillospira sp.]|jgi:cardiolipin synthase